MTYREVFMNRTLGLFIVLTVSLLLGACATSDPVADNSSTTRKLQHLPRPKGPRKIVTIYEFRSAVPEVSAAGATDMFTTALIKSGYFAVAERQRLEEGVVREKQLNAQGMTTGNTASQRLAGAQYVFEGAVTEANDEESSNGIAGTVRGLGVESSGQKGSIGLDVRVIDANNGLVIDSINVRKAIKQGGYSASGIGAFIQSFTNHDLQGADVSVSHGSKEGVDKAVRACIEEAIYQIVTRYGN